MFLVVFKLVSQIFLGKYSLIQDMKKLGILPLSISWTSKVESKDASLHTEIVQYLTFKQIYQQSMAKFTKKSFEICDRLLMYPG